MSIRTRATGALPYWLVAGAAIAISGVNSYRVAHTALHLTGPMQWAILGIVEGGLIAAGVGLRAASLGRDETGRHRKFLGALFVLVALGAVLVLGPVDAAVQVGVVTVGVWAWHLALGLEVAQRTARPSARGAFGRVIGELRERALSRLGLADDARAAAERTRDRAVTRAARLSLRVPRRWTVWRLQRALVACGATSDPVAQARVVEQLRVLRYARDLATLTLDSPWVDAALAPRTPLEQREPGRARGERVDRANSDDVRAQAVLDGVILADATPPAWEGMSQKDAVARADALLPKRTARALACALAEVGVEISPESVRGVRSRARTRTPAHQDA